jgi:GNAT superfamily N-acetyltransferase
VVEIVRVGEAAQMQAVAELAREIWNEHFVSIIGQAQVDYMLSRFQSAPAIGGQIAEGYDYYLVNDGGQRIGYFALVPNRKESSAQLSKIYLRRPHRGRGLGRAILAFAQAYCVERGIGKLWLTVNRHNTGPIAFYRRMGFTRTESLVQDIGSGFVMDDYKMVKRIGHQADRARRRKDHGREAEH